MCWEQRESLAHWCWYSGVTICQTDELSVQISRKGNKNFNKTKKEIWAELVVSVWELIVCVGHKGPVITYWRLIVVTDSLGLQCHQCDCWTTQSKILSSTGSFHLTAFTSLSSTPSTSPSHTGTFHPNDHNFPSYESSKGREQFIKVWIKCSLRHETLGLDSLLRTSSSHAGDWTDVQQEEIGRCW